MAKARPYNRLIGIAGSGERLIALLDMPDLDVVYAIDQNQEALFLLELKVIALKFLEVEDYLVFCGYKIYSSESRLEMFFQFKGGLSADCRTFWEKHHACIGMGICHIGHFERFLARVRPIVRPILGRNFMKVFKGDYSRFPSLRWKLVKSSFSIKFSYLIFGNSDTAFVGQGTQNRCIPEGIQYLVDHQKMAESFMAHLIFYGNLRNMAAHCLPPSLQPSILASIKGKLQDNALEIKYLHNDLLKALKTQVALPEGEQMFSSLSDVLSFISVPYLSDCILEISRIGRCGTRVAVRAFLKNRDVLSELQKSSRLEFTFRDFSEFESTAMYKVYEIECL